MEYQQCETKIQKYEEEFQAAQVVIKQKYKEGHEAAYTTSQRRVEVAQAIAI